MRTTERSWVKLPKRDIPLQIASIFSSLPEPFLGRLKEPISSLFDEDGNFSLGPIPKGFPVNLAANYRPVADIDDLGERAEHNEQLIALLGKLAANLPPPSSGASDAEILDWVKKLKDPLLKLSKCPDFVVNRGHYFGTAQFNVTDGLSDDEKSFGKEPVLSDEDKRALIEFLKTF